MRRESSAIISLSLSSFSLGDDDVDDDCRGGNGERYRRAESLLEATNGRAG